MSLYSGYTFNPNTTCKLIPDNLDKKNILFIGNIVNLLGYFNLDTKSLSIYESSDYSIRCCANLFNGTNHIFAFCPEEGYNYFTNISNYIGKSIISIPRKNKKDFIWHIDNIDMISDKKQKKQAKDKAISEFQEFLDIIKKNNMEFDLIIANPPYSIGEKVITKAISCLLDNGKAHVLMPLHQYKKDLYKYVESFEPADPKLFKDARIGENLSIVITKKTEVNNYNWQDLLFDSLDKKMLEFYKYNYTQGPKYKLERKDSKQNKPFDWCNSDLDFIDTGRCISLRNGYGYHAKSAYAYRYNVTKQNIDNEWLHCLCYIHFPSKLAKDNFCKYAYNYSDNKYDCLASKALCGARAVSTSNDYYFVIPQIDWEKISDTSLWKERKYDEAVLSVMGLKYDENEVIIKK